MLMVIQANTYLALLRGINVGGKNKLPMTDLKKCLEDLGFKNVQTYIQSGNVIFESGGTPEKLAGQIEKALPKNFRLDSELIRVLAISRNQLAKIVAKAPKGFGTEPDKYHSDVLFLIDTSADEVMKQTDVNPEVDAAWPGDGVVYYRRLSAKRTKSRLSKLVSKPIYKSMTIRSWNTTTKLLALMDERS